MNFSFKNLSFNAYEMDGGLWFLANDVCRTFGFRDIAGLLAEHTSLEDCKTLKYPEWVKMTGTESLNKRDRVLVNEAGLYCLALASTKKTVKEFKHWVTGIVLPSIRKHGGYILDQEVLTSEQKEEISKEIEEIFEETPEVKKSKEDRMPFELWVTREVLPSIRKHGGFINV